MLAWLKDLTDEEVKTEGPQQTHKEHVLNMVKLRRELFRLEKET